MKRPLQRIVTGGMFTATAFFISGFLELELAVSIYVHTLKTSLKIVQTKSIKSYEGVVTEEEKKALIFFLLKVALRKFR